VRNINVGHKSKGYQQIDKQRVLNVNNYALKHSNKGHNKSNAKRVKQALGNQKNIARQTKTMKANKQVSNKQRIINQSKHQQKQKLSNNFRANKNTKFDTKQNNSGKSQKYATLGAQNNKQRSSSVKTYKNASAYNSSKSNGNKSSNKSNSYRASSNKQNKSRPVKVARQSNSKGKQR
jgi:hypothetical protein